MQYATHTIQMETGQIVIGIGHFSQTAQGMRWSVTGDYQLDKDGKPRNQFDGFHGWHGLLAYCTKTIFSEADLAEHTDAYLYTCLINTPTCSTTSKPNLTDFL